jgi:hypothetical protein
MDSSDTIVDAALKALSNLDPTNGKDAQPKYYLGFS